MVCWEWLWNISIICRAFSFPTKRRSFYCSDYLFNIIPSSSSSSSSPDVLDFAPMATAGVRSQSVGLLLSRVKWKILLFVMVLPSRTVVERVGQKLYRRSLSNRPIIDPTPPKILCRPTDMRCHLYCFNFQDQPPRSCCFG